MAGHVDVDVVVPLPLDLVWTVSNEYERWEANRHNLLATTPDGQRFSFQVTTHPDREGRTWTFNVERCLYPEQHAVYARRWGNPSFRYSVAWWLYSETEAGCRIRSVQDFEMADGAPTGDREMEQVIASGTRAALERMSARIVAAAGEAAQPVRS
jgi:aromatase